MLFVVEIKFTKNKKYVYLIPSGRQDQRNVHGFYKGIFSGIDNLFLWLHKLLA